MLGNLHFDGVGNLLKLTEQQREIWAELLHQPELSRVLDVAPDLQAKPITQAEELFVNFLILHLNSAYQAVRAGMFSSPEGLKADVKEFFSCPIPKVIWEKMKKFQNRKFAAFVESCRAYSDGLFTSDRGRADEIPDTGGVDGYGGNGAIRPEL